MNCFEEDCAGNSRESDCFEPSSELLCIHSNCVNCLSFIFEKKVKKRMVDFEGDMSSKTYIKVPKFNGKDKKFPVWKKQMTSFLSQTGCGALIAACPGVPKVCSLVSFCQPWHHPFLPLNLAAT